MRTRSTLPVLLSSLLFLICVTPLHADGDTYDLWYTVLMSGKPTGYSHQSATRLDDGKLELQTQTQITIAREAIRLTIRMDTVFLENEDGTPYGGKLIQTLGTMKVSQEYNFNKNGSIELSSEQNGQKIKQHLPAPTQQWLTPTQSQKYVEDQLAKGNKQISFWTIEPASGPQPIQITMKHLGAQTINVVGKTVPATAWEMSTSLMPGMVTKAWTDENILPLKTTMSPMPGLDMEVVLSDKLLATQQVNPPELLVSTMIHPNKPLPQPRNLKYAEYELIINNAGPGEPIVGRDSFLETSTQQVTWIDDQHVKLTVDVKGDPTIEDVRPDAGFLKATAMLNCDDPMIQKAVQNAIGNANKMAHKQAALALRDYVHRIIEHKDLSVGFATASEVIRTKQGDCSEHGVLLAAMLRGAGIPSRIVSGLIYVDAFLSERNIFGYHMWAQAWIDGKWVDLDATLPGTVFDAAHIAMVSSNTDQGNTMNDLVKLTPLIGRLKINVLHVR